MAELKSTDRLAYLAEKFEVFETTEKALKEKIKSLENKEIKFEVLRTSKILAIIYLTGKNELKPIRNISISFEVFSDMVDADPTPNKSCVQWMLTTFSRYLKIGGDSLAQAIRFVDEDLPLASSYISLFESNKHKQKFKNLCKGSYILKNVENPTDINQYKSLSQLYDAIDPFIERNLSELENLLQRYVDSGQALIPVKDRKFCLYIPLTLDASVIFEKFASWCTARVGNGMFNNYTNHLKPDGTRSNLYIIINNKFFTGESQEVYQIHFETNQLKNRHNSQENIFENVINESEGLSNFFHDELITMAKSSKGGLDNNKYLDFLIQFGFCESLFELIEEGTPIIKFETRKIPRLPDISRFKEMDQLIITNADMVELNPSIGKLKKLEMLVLTQNKIKFLPTEIGELKNLVFLNLIGNPLQEIPEEIKYLDRSNGGSLFRVAVREEDIGDENFRKLKKLLPSTTF